MTTSVLEATVRIALTKEMPVLTVGGRMEALLGFKAKEFLTSRVTLRDLIHPDDADIADDLFAPQIQEEETAFNIRLRHADGRIRCLKGHYTKKADSDGRFVLKLRLQDAKSLRQGADGETMTANFRAMMENSDDFIFFKDRNHVLTAASRNILTSLDLVRHPEGLLGLTDYDVFPEEYADIYYRLEKQVFAGKAVAQEIQDSLTIDGKQAWIDNRKYPIRNDDGQIVGLFGVARNITLRMQATDNLRESEIRYRTLVESASDGIFVADADFRYVEVNAAACRMLGYTREELLTRSIADIVVSGEAARIAPETGRLNASGPLRSEWNFRRKDGSSFLGEVSANRLPDGRFLAIVHDVTERRRIEDALRASEESLREAQRIAGLGSYVLDARTGVWTSSKVLDGLFGIDEAYERTVDGWTEIIHPGDRAMMAAYLADEVIGRGETFDKEYRIVRRTDQAVRWVHGMGWLEFDAQGKPLMMRGTIQDITKRKQTEGKLRESQELLLQFIEYAPAALAMFDRQMRYLAVSRRWQEDYAVRDEEIIGRCHYDVVPDIPERWKEEHRRGMAGETLKVEEDRFERADGTVNWIRWEVRPWRLADGTVGGIILFAEDITLKKETEERLRLAASVFTHAREGILITNAAGTIIEVNDTFSRVTGYSREEVLGRNPRLLKSGLQGPEFYAEMWRTLAQKGQWSGEVWNRGKSGNIFPEMLTISAVNDENGQVQQYVALFSDISILKEHERQLEHIAHFDVLTGLPNRVLFADRLRQAMAQAHRQGRLLAVAYLDLDGFKAVNDHHGHEAGDMLLAEVAHSMKQTLREGDTLARLGGDEFVAVLLDLADLAASEPVLSRLLEAASKPLHVGGLTLQVSASVGVAFYPQAEDVDADQLLRQSDQAMYQAKQAGRNRYQVFDSRQDLSVRGHHEDLAHIGKALAAREFVLYYQPKVNMRTGAVIGAEALIRWQHPERGQLPPAMFLPVIEDHLLAVEVGEWVIDAALTQMERWLEGGLDLAVSVNVGAQQLQQANFVNRLRALLAAHPAIKPSSLQLEVLETSALQDVVQVSKVINACREIGVSFALDDFGTGYASLTYLKHLPAHVLKIDQSFVREMLDDAESLSILEGVLGLASAFRRQVIAEGVETVEHGLLLLQLDCKLAQGYGIARPMPADKIAAWMASWRPDPRWKKATAVSLEGRPALYAGVEHRAWIAAIDAFLKGERHLAPGLDHRECRFCAWLDGEGRAGRGGLPALQAIDAMHRHIHGLAAELLDLKLQNWDAEVLAGLGELHGLQTALLGQLEILMQKA